MQHCLQVKKKKRDTSSLEIAAEIFFFSLTWGSIWIPCVVVWDDYGSLKTDLTQDVIFLQLSTPGFFGLSFSLLGFLRQHPLLVSLPLPCSGNAVRLTTHPAPIRLPFCHCSLPKNFLFLKQLHYKHKHFPRCSEITIGAVWLAKWATVANSSSMQFACYFTVHKKTESLDGADRRYQRKTRKHCVHNIWSCWPK